MIDDYDIEIKKNANETEDHQIKTKIPQAVRELQTSYNDATKTYLDSLEEGGNAFMGFALASEATTYPDEPTTFQEVWHHENAQEREGW